MKAEFYVMCEHRPKNGVSVYKLGKANKWIQTLFNLIGDNRTF